MEWCVVKSGAESFDALHAWGLGVFLAHITRAPIELKDAGTAYMLYSRGELGACTLVDILDEICALPSLEELQRIEKKAASLSITVARMDGLLAALFTTPGPRVVSIADLFFRQGLDPSSAEDALAKVDRAVKRWKNYAERRSHNLATDWIEDVQQCYAPAQPQIPVPIKLSQKHISVPMTLDPAFGFSASRPLSDGFITEKTNITMRGSTYAPLFALVGAAHVLRAHRSSGKQVNFYVPLPDTVVLTVDTILPALPSVQYASDRAVVAQWLRYWYLAKSLAVSWRSLAYQTMQTQGVQQSISVGRGCLAYAWLAQIEQDLQDSSMIRHWKCSLSRPPEQLPYETNNLVFCLMDRCIRNWTAHLHEMTLFLRGAPDDELRPYSVREVEVVTMAMDDSSTAPLSEVLKQEQGARSFGYALRLLKRQNNAALRTICEDLDTVQNVDQLLRVLAQATQACSVGAAKTKYMRVPCDKDLEHLLDQVDRYGVRNIASLLLILAELRYPKQARNGDSTSQERG